MPTIKSKFFRVAVEGDTTDGRKIERSWIEQAAKRFNTATYGARIWLEHIRSYLPDSPFKAYGDVLAVKAEEVEIDGKKKLALFAQIEPTPELVAMNKARQKLYTSCEFSPNFANSGEAYLVGLAVTDSPASLGTEMLAFAAGATANPLAERKQDKDNLFTAAAETVIEFEEVEGEPGIGAKLLASVKELLSRKGNADKQEFGAIGEAVQEVAGSQAELLEKFAKLQGDLEKATHDLAAAQKQIKEGAEAFAAFKEQIDQTEAPGQQRRPAADGGNGAVVTDC